jgi:hypothetical protein
MPDFRLRDLTSIQWRLLLGTLIIAFGFGIFFFFEGNYEFLGYFPFLLFFIFFVAVTLTETRLPNTLLALLLLWFLMCMLGGSLHVGDAKLYDTMVWHLYGKGTELAFLRYDQLVHLLGTGLLAAAIHWSIRTRSPQTKIIWRIAFGALVAMGLGTLNEIIEFSAVLILPNTGVRGYYNNELDLVFNALGAIGAVLLIELYLRLKSKPR